MDIMDSASDWDDYDDTEEEEDGEPFEPKIATIRKKEKVEDFYDIKEQLGKGRYGTVYRCIEKTTGKVWAAKYIKALKSKDKDMARNEINTMNLLKHPKLLQCVDAFETSNRVVMITEYISGGELFERVVDDDFDLTEREVIMYMRQVCEGVQHMHQNNFLHLDLKPENIMCVDKIGTSIKLIDFGMARKLEPDENVKVLFGTPEFVAPEVVNYERIGFPTDMWSLGVICYVLLSGLSPFMGDTDAETFNNVTAAEWDFEDEAFDDVSTDAKDFIIRLLVKDKEHRRTIAQCLEHPWLVRKTLTHRQGNKLRNASLRLKGYMARRRWQKTATAVRAIGRMTALRLFSNHKKTTGQDPLASNDSASLAELLKAKREEDALRLAQEAYQQIEPTPGDGSNIDLNDRNEAVERQSSSDIIVQAQPLESYQIDELPPRRAIDTDTGGVGDNADESTPTVTRQITARDTLTADTEAPFSNYASDLTSSDRTSDLAENDRASDHGLADFNSHTSDSEDMNIDVDNPAREVTDAATTIQAVYRGHRTRKRTYQHPAIHQDLRDCEVFEGSAARFDCRISGFPEPQVYWYKDGREIKESRHFRIEFEGEDLCSLIIREAGPDDEGVYKCEARNPAGVACSEAELLVEVLGGDGFGEEDRAPSEQSLVEKRVIEEQVGPQERIQSDQLDPSSSTDVTTSSNRQKQEKVTLANDFVTAPQSKEIQTTSNRSDLDYLSGGDKSSSDWTPRSSPCTSTGVSPSSSLLELDSWYKRGRASNFDIHHQASRQSGSSTGKVTERISRYDERLKGPKQTVNSARANLRSTGTRSGRAASPEGSRFSKTAGNTPYVSNVERPSRLRLAELESKRKIRSSSEPPPEFQHKREQILTRHSKPEQSKAGKNYTSRETYEQLLRSSRVPSADEGSASRSPKPQLATKISVFSGTGSNGKTDKKSGSESKPDKKIYAGREIKVKSLPKVVVSREESHLKGRPIESIRVNHDRTNGRLSSDDSLTDSERSSTSSGYPEPKKPVYRTEKNFELLGDRAFNSRKPGAVLAWKIEKFAKGSPLKSPRDLEEETQQPTMQAPVRKWSPSNGAQQRRSQSVERPLYPGQGGGSLAARIEKFSSNTTNTQDVKLRSETHDPVISKKYEYSQAKVADKEPNKDQRRPDINYAKKTEPTSTRQKFQGTSDKLLNIENVKLTKDANQVPRTKQTSDAVINITKGSKGTIDIAIPVGNNEKAIEVSKASVVYTPPPEKKHQIPMGKTNGDASSESLKPAKVEVVLKSSANDLSAGSSALITSMSSSKTSSLGNGSKENTSEAKPQASITMNRRGVLPGGIGKITAKFENGKAVDTPSKSMAKIEPVVMSRLSDKKQLFDGTGKAKTNGSSVDYRDVLSSSSAGKMKSTTVSSAGKPSVKIAKSLVEVKAKSPSALASRYQVRSTADEKPPTFVQKPRDQTGTEGGSIYFAVSVEGNPKPDLSWHYKGRTLKDEGRYELYTEKDLFFLEIFDLEPKDAGVYTCRLVNKVGRVSATAELKVTEKPKPVIPKGQAPSFLRRITDCEVCEGDRAVFECKVAGDPSPDITWIMDGKVVQEDRRHQITRKPDGTCALVISDVTEEDDAVYTCTAKNGLGMVSSTAELIVEFDTVPNPKEPKKEEVIEKVSSKAQPKTSKVEPKPAPKKEEKVESALKDDTNSLMKKQDEEPHAEPSQIVHHQPRRSSLQSAAPAARPPEFILRPRSTHITPPETARFTCMVKGFPTPTVTWKRNTKILKDEGRFEIYQDGGEHFLEIYDTVDEDAGRYTCVIANELGKTTSSANIALRGKVTMDIPPKFIQRLTNCRTKDGGVGRFSCRVSGEPAPTIQWLFLGKEISPDDDIYEITFDGEKATLVLPEVLPEDEGEYECIARNRAGQVSCRARLSVEIPPTEPVDAPEPVLPNEHAAPTEPTKKTPWPFERKTSRTEIFLQSTPSESEEEGMKSTDVPKQEQVFDYKEDTQTASSSESEEDVPKAETLEHEMQIMDVQEDVEAKKKPTVDNIGNQDAEGNPAELELVPDSEPAVHSKPTKQPDEFSVDRSLADSDTVSVQIESNQNEPEASSFDLKLDLESESESELEASLRIVEPTKDIMKAQPEECRDLERVDTAAELQSESHLDGLSEIDVSVAESHDLESITDDRNVVFLGDAEAEPAIEAETTTDEESTPPATEAQSKPEFLQTLSDVEVMDGSPLALTVKVTGIPEPEVMWIFDSCEILEDDDFKLLHDGELHSLVIREVYPEDAGVYICKAFNAAGEDQCSAKIVVKDPVLQGTPPKFTQKPRSMTVDEGSSLRITYKIEGDPEPAITWSKDGRIISPGQRILMKKLGIGSLRILQIPAALSTDAGSYSCMLSNAFGEEKCSVSVVVHPLEGEQTDFRQLLKSRPRLQNMNNNNTIKDNSDKSSPESEAQQLDFRHVLTRHVQTKKAPKFVEELQDVRTKEGELAVLQCRIEGIPKPTIAWTVDGREIRESKYFKMTTEGTLVKLTITEAFPEDEGEYSCIASNTAGQDKTTSDLKIIPWEEDENDDDELFIKSQESSKVIDSPRDHLDEVFKRTLTISEDDDDEVADNPDAPPHPAITITEASPKKSKKPPPVPAKKTSLTRMKAPSFDEPDSERPGKAAEPRANTSGDGTADSEPPTRPQFVQGLCDKQIVEGTAVVLECRVTGEPEPDIYWYRDGVEIGETDPKYRYEFEGEHGVSLVINNARMSDAGTYTCKAVSAAGSAESSAQLIGGVPAKVEGGPKNIQVIAGQTLTISCQITGCPEPEVTWTKYRKEVEECERKHIDVTDSTTTLVVRQANEADAGRYTLSVCNELGGDCFEISVSVVDKPDPPAGKPTASDISLTSLTLSWPGPSYDGGSRILGYVVEMCRADEDRKWQNVTSTASTSHVISNLKPEVEYLFRVSAENEHGVSEPSPVSDPVLTVVGAASDRDEKTGGESEEETDEFVVRGNVTIRTDKEVTDLYEMKEQCGKGRFGVVYRCLEKTTGKQFAAKFIKIKSSDREAVRSEIRIMNELHHPKLLQCVDAFEGPRQMVMVMEYIAGGELFERVIDDDFVLTEKDAIKFMRQICAGVHYMHQQNILHLDLKPENVMCMDTHGCRIKLIDFGLARKFDPTKSTKVMFGTPEFVAPEVINYEQISFATDLWSVGVICYILLSGLSPFMGDTDAETLSNVTAAEWDFDDEAFDDISDESKDFIEKLLIKRKEKRQTVEDCLKHKWLNKDIKTMKATQLSTAKLKKFVARRRWQVQALEGFSNV
ncbi:myosin light chain kinase, smooth muscle-like isoform X2 [Acanthaster planci]|uniref:Myosin light chain kinase, smooth muscle n=1 Tax=Acanthaster planci TaxID=133434 RepID=A0A8B7Z8W9_ACAPL|nr:myosin light chain kinase, smooth muscle-like isoform X2 [Acanthaster planci]